MKYFFKRDMKNTSNLSIHYGIKKIPEIIFTFNIQKALILILLLLTFISTILFVRYPFNLNEGMNSPIKEVEIEVEYDKSWIGSVTNGGVHQSFSGTKTSSIIIERPNDATLWVISASAQKGDGSSDTLILRIKNLDGEILAEKSTYIAHGLVASSVTIR
jgi:hypothetical protein